MKKLKSIMSKEECKLIREDRKKFKDDVDKLAKHWGTSVRQVKRMITWAENSESQRRSKGVKKGHTKRKADIIVKKSSNGVPMLVLQDLHMTFLGKKNYDAAQVTLDKMKEVSTS